MDLNAGQLTWSIYSSLVQWTNGAYGESWTFAGTTLSEMSTSVELPTSHHFHPSLSPVVSLSLGILHKWMRMQMLAKIRTSSRKLEVTTGTAAHNLDEEHSWWPVFAGSWDTWCKIGLSTDWCLCTSLHTRSGACYYWIGLACITNLYVWWCGCIV